MPTGGRADGRDDRIDVVRSRHHDFQTGDGIAQIEIKLRLVERHEDEGRVIFAHADVEGACDRIGLYPGRDAERRDVSPRRDQRDGSAGTGAKLGGETRADDDRVSATELS